MRWCVAHNELWPWPISSRSFSHDFAIKLLKYGTSGRARSTAYTVLDGFFPCLAQMITSMRGSVTCNDPWPWPIYFRSFSHYFAIKLLKYDTSCHVRSTTCTVLDGFPSIFGTNDHYGGIRGCVVHNDLWLWPIYSRSWWLCNKTAKMCHILSYLLHNVYSSGLILSLFSTNAHKDERVCHMQWYLTLTYIFNII